MKFKIGQNVKVTLNGGKFLGIVLGYEHFVFGSLYSVKLEDGEVLNKLGWNNLEAL